MEKKILLLEQEYNNDNENNKITFEFVEANKFPHTIYLYLNKIFNSFREDHNLICMLLSFCSSIEEKEIMGHFFSEFLSSNLFSSFTLDDEYILILTRMLISEIANISEMNSFLSEESICKNLLSNLYKKEEIKEYFVQMLKPCLAEIESWNTFVSFELNDIVNDVREEINAKIGLKQGETATPSQLTETFLETIVESGRVSAFNSSNKNGVVPLTRVINKRIEFVSKIEFFNEYVPNLTEELLTEYYGNTSYADNKIYLLKQIEKLKANPSEKLLFSNEKFFYQLSTIKGIEGKEAIELYRDYFGKCIKVINKLIQKLIKHIDIVPSSIKTVIKIMEILLKRQFPAITNVELYSYLSRFFMNLLFYPIFTNPDKCGLIDHLITPFTKHNIEIVAIIIQKFFSCEFFHANEENGLTIFNIFFIKNYGVLTYFYENLLQKANIPSIIDEFILDTLKNSSNVDEIIKQNNYAYKYNFFERYPNEHIKEGIVLFDINLSIIMLEVLNKNMNELTNYSRCQNNQTKKVTSVDSLIKSISLIYSQNKNEQLHKELINDKKQNKRRLYGMINQEYSPTFKSITKLTDGMISFAVNDQQTQGDKTVSTINIFKNSICKLLYNTYPLKQSCLYIASNKEPLTTNDIITLLSKANDVSYSSFDNNIEMNWTSHILEGIVKQIPPENKNNDFSSIYDEIINDLMKEKEEIVAYNEAISSLHETMRFVEKYKTEVSRIWKNIKEEKMQKIIKRYIMEDNFYSYHVVLHKKKGNYCAQLTMDYSNKKGKTLFEFCNEFPNFMELFELESNPFDKLKEIAIGDLLRNCFTNTKKAVISKFFIYGLDKLIERKIPELNQYEIQNYSEEQQKKIINDIITRDDKEIKERFIRDYGYSKKKTKNEQTFFWSDMELINQISDIIKEFIMFRLHPVFFPSEQTAEDKRIHEKLSVLEFLCKPSSIKKDIPHENIIIASLPKAKKYIKQFETERTPKTKKTAVLKLLDLLNQIINYGKNSNNEMTTIDDMLPLLMYFLIKSCPLHFDSNVSYLEVFLGLFNESEQFLALLKTPKILLENVDVNIFNRISRQDEFDEQLEKCLSKQYQ